MNTNLIYYGNFSLPSITANTAISSTSFTTEQATAFYWTPGGSYMSLLNGVPTTNFINPSLVGYTQACYLLLGSSIQQSFTVPFTGSYILSLYYSIRTGYPLSMQIYINGVLFDTVVSTSTIWVRYIITVPSSNLNLGINTILFQATSGGNAIVITGISLVYGQTGGAAPLTTATYNNFKTTYINGSLTVLDWIPTGGSLVQGTISTQRHYNFNYATLPTFYSSSLGYIYFYTTTAITNPGANSFTPSGSLTIPIGVYIVDTYCLFTPGSSATHTLKLGISTVNNALTTFNYTMDNTLTASALAHSIQYKYILSNTASTNYFLYLIHK